MIYILNFNNSRELADIKYSYDMYGQTNIDFILDDFIKGETNWTVPKKTLPGDIAIFMCAKSARNNLGMATSHIPDDYDQGFRDFVDEQKSLYKEYSGYLLGYGIVASAPEYDASDNHWYADINQLCQFTTPIYINEFNSFINTGNSSFVVYLNSDQGERLKWVINQKNPGIFQNVTAPDVEVINQEFDKAVQKKGKKLLSTLKKEALKKASQPPISTVQTKTYYRDATIAAYVKKRANGYCQLCGSPAPFIDQYGEPYLENHHIIWLSKGGMDSVDNCVALCPNCHRKMHLVTDQEDIAVLTSIAKLHDL